MKKKVSIIVWKFDSEQLVSGKKVVNARLDLFKSGRKRKRRTWVIHKNKLNRLHNSKIKFSKDSYLPKKSVNGSTDFDIIAVDFFLL